MPKPGSYCSRTIFYCLTLVSFFFIFCAETKSKETIDVSNAWIRAAPGGATMFAGYFSITNSSPNARLGDGSAKNKSSGAVILTSITSPHFKHIMMHRSVIRGGVAEMEHVNKFAIQPGQTRLFEPGGYHLMLMQPLSSIDVGKAFPIKMKFQSGKEKTISFKVRRQ